MALPLAKLRLYLSLIPLLRQKPGITFREIGEHIGLSAQAARKEIPEALMLCGVPPYMPHDYIACDTEGDRVTVYFADHFKRPARLTLGEAAAFLLALRALPPARGAPAARAVAGLMRKLEHALGTKEVKRLARRIGARRGSGALGERMRLLQQGLEEQREEFDYEKRREIGFQIQDRLMGEILPGARYFNDIGRTLRRPYVKNGRDWPWFGPAYWYANVWLDSTHPQFQGRPS